MQNRVAAKRLNIVRYNVSTDDTGEGPDTLHIDQSVDDDAMAMRKNREETQESRLDLSAEGRALSQSCLTASRLAKNA